ncbi:zf-TFIIB domain-containing protein [Helicobacter burdigaliensis]|uniref:TFIIB-type zinc ribbon-containing protein n=1 Tax=Helicobacter burdigaliensis TaxID=2315334 RepID=UPI000EF74CB7|nr:zf-TFIIB domain-containing protein [Helicobacter burdigaliensis]
MLCPVCNVDLVMSERSGVEIDYCPKCRGVWLDRGELDKIIERASSVAQPQQQNRNYQEDRGYQERGNVYREHKDSGYYHKPKKRESFFSELFDF